MWVRSQDRLDMGNVRRLEIKLIDNEFLIVEFVENTIISRRNKYRNIETYHPYGKYDTKEQAIKVLDMIQGEIDCQMNYNARPARMRDDDYWQKVFQMPTIEEVELLMKAEKDLEREG